MFHGYGLSICLRYVNNRDEAIEVLNDSFLKVFQNLDSFDTTKPFKPWFRRIVVNTAINHIQKYSKYANHQDLDEALDIGNKEEIVSGINYQEMLSLVRELPPAYRTVFNLYVIEGYKHADIAEILEISEGTSKSNLFKAKKYLQQAIHRLLNENYERQG
ncbi:RNA polymerase sigma factor [Flammeovirgaceae bacterium KN852]|uniref:RNA polymerase sigma factor n=2 Tax=Marinigracilibium pacificum TaxID=2729599 RepID=A0A848IXE3_9BACT|nr:RNA polymerase sigma factor [Marinigracilibium pacificum]